MQYPQITIFLQQKQLQLLLSAEQTVTFPIAIGKPATPTPNGKWNIVNKKILPDAGPFGTHWLGISRPGYGIHGTNRSELIGTAVSGGCIRMHNKDIAYVFERVRIGTDVVIVE